MTNIKLLEVLTIPKLLEMGFKEENDGSGDVRGIDYNIRNDKFWLMVDPWGEVKLRRVNPDTDPLIIHCETLSELQTVVDWIQP